MSRVRKGEEGGALLGPVIVEDLRLVVVAVGAEDAVVAKLAGVPHTRLDEAAVAGAGATANPSEDDHGGADDTRVRGHVAGVVTVEWAR